MRGDSQKRIEKCVFSFLFAAVVFVEETRLPVTHTKKKHSAADFNHKNSSTSSVRTYEYFKPLFPRSPYSFAYYIIWFKFSAKWFFFFKCAEVRLKFEVIWNIFFRVDLIVGFQNTPKSVHTKIETSIDSI